MNIINPAIHNHRPTTINGQMVCMDCHEVLIKPKLSFDDFADEQYRMWLDAVKSLCPRPIDWLWIELSDRLDIEWPQYIDILSERYGGEMPPHAQVGPYAWDAEV